MPGSPEKNVKMVRLLEATSRTSCSKAYVAIGCIGYMFSMMASRIFGVLSQLNKFSRLQSDSISSKVWRDVIFCCHSVLPFLGTTIAATISSTPLGDSGTCSIGSRAVVNSMALYALAYSVSDLGEV